MSTRQSGPEAAGHGLTVKSAAPLVYIVILHWRDTDATLACLRSLDQLDYPHFRVVLVDNGSGDATLDSLARPGSIDIIRNPANLGFTGGMNVGLRHAHRCDADYVWLLNSDATSCHDTLTKLVAAAEADSRIGLVSPVIRDPAVPERYEFCGFLFGKSLRANQTSDPGQARIWQETRPGQFLLIGTALLIRRAVIDRIGELDEAFFAYLEDLDYSLRSLRAGFTNVVVPDAVIFHRFKQPVEDPAASPAYLHYYVSRNHLLLWRKLRPSRLAWSRAALWFLHERLQQVERMNGNQALVNALLAGLWDGLRGVTGEYDPSHRMPQPFCSLLGRFPGVWLRLLGRAS